MPDVVPGPNAAVVFAQGELHHLFPEWMLTRTFVGLSAAQWLGLAICTVLAYTVGLVLEIAFRRFGPLFARRTRATWDDHLAALLAGPLRLILTLFALARLLPLLELGADAASTLRSLLAAGLVIAVTWLLVQLLDLACRTLVARHTGAETTPQARALRTQVAVVQTIARFFLILAGVALIMMQFEVARSAGVSLLASAGIAGIAVGFAAQRTVATLFAGIQLAFTKIVKIGDAVMIEGQFGTIEDIRLTYVVVKIWDLRRLILPVTYFMEKPIENWTVTSTELLGTVTLNIDFSIAVDDLRAELKNILGQTNLWDGTVQQVQVTNLTGNCAEVRLLVSAANPISLWDLRCLIREKLLDWLRARMSPG